MNTTIMAAIIVGVLVLATLGVVNFVKAESTPTKTTTQASGPTCGAGGGCDNGCTADKNCGLSTCGATPSKPCSCGK